jgi:hypothetical protein
MPSTDDRLERWRAEFEEMFFALVAGRFAQAESRRRARLYLLGDAVGRRAKEFLDDRRAGRPDSDGTMLRPRRQSMGTT